jgi:osmotically-inducible protein OsmY
MASQEPAQGGAVSGAPAQQLVVPEVGLDGSADAPKHGALGHLSSDEELQQAVCSALIETQELDSSAIEVRAAQARIVLSGTVRNDTEQRLAVRIAEAHAGAGAVDGDELHVRRVP